MGLLDAAPEIIGLLLLWALFTFFGRVVEVLSDAVSAIRKFWNPNASSGIEKSSAAPYKRDDETIVDFGERMLTQGEVWKAVIALKKATEMRLERAENVKAFKLLARAYRAERRYQDAIAAAAMAQLNGEDAEAKQLQQEIWEERRAAAPSSAQTKIAVRKTERQSREDTSRAVQLAGEGWCLEVEPREPIRYRSLNCPYIRDLSRQSDVLKRYPENGDMWREHAETLHDARQFQNAENALLKALKINPDDLDAREMRIRWQLCDVQPVCEKKWRDYANDLFKAGRLNDARPALIMAVYCEDSDKERGQIYALLALAYLRTGQLKPAQSRATLALKLAPDVANLLAEIPPAPKAKKRVPAKKNDAEQVNKGKTKRRNSFRSRRGL